MITFYGRNVNRIVVNTFFGGLVFLFGRMKYIEYVHLNIIVCPKRF